jgi:shikimate kinase
MSRDFIVLVGPMGSGKTTVGRLTAERLGWHFADSDTHIEERFGTSGRRLAEERGVEWLHQVEAEALFDALGGPRPAVIAAAASVVDRADVLRRLQDPAVALVLLDGDAEVLAERAGAGDHRRPIDQEAARLLAARRRRSTRPIAEMVVDVGSVTAQEAAALVVDCLAE